MPERDWAEVVRGLRAKADSTQFPAEAQALRVRADELVAKYGIVERQRDDLDEQLDDLQRQWDAWEAEQLRRIEHERAVFQAHMDQQRARAEMIRQMRANAGQRQWVATGTSTMNGSWVTFTFG